MAVLLFSFCNVDFNVWLLGVLGSLADAYLVVAFTTSSSTSPGTGVPPPFPKQFNTPAAITTCTMPCGGLQPAVVEGSSAVIVSSCEVVAFLDLNTNVRRGLPLFFLMPVLCVADPKCFCDRWPQRCGHEHAAFLALMLWTHFSPHLAFECLLITDALSHHHSAPSPHPFGSCRRSLCRRGGLSHAFPGRRCICCTLKCPITTTLWLKSSHGVCVCVCFSCETAQ